jgi:nicotinamidase-related amidase
MASPVPPAQGARVHGDSDERRAARLAAASGRACALLLIDLQNDYCHADGVFARAGFTVADLPALVRATNAVIAAARAASVPVIWTATTWKDSDDVGLLAQRSPFLAAGGLRPGTWGWQILDGLDYDAANDVVVEKRRFSAFHETGLPTVLGDAEVLVVGGVRTDFCVESTVRDAFFRDYDVFVVRDAVAGFVPALHEHSLRLMNTVFAQVVNSAEASGLLAAVPRRRAQA